MPGPSIGLVLSGGGARGAYEAGVLKYIADRLPELLERVHITSLGAAARSTRDFGDLFPRQTAPDSQHDNLARLGLEAAQ